MSQTSKYGNKNPLHQYVLNRFLNQVKNAVDESKANKILEVGSADGYVVGHLKKYNSSLELYGVDIDEKILERAREMNPGTRFEYGNLETGVLPTRRFDMVTALEVFEHIGNTEASLSNLNKLDAEYFLISVPHEPFFRILNFIRGRHWRRWGNHHEHVHTWSRNEFKRTIGKYFLVKKDYSSFPWTCFLAIKKNIK